MGFASPPDPEDFNRRVWAIVELIPFGTVATYGQIARHLSVPETVNLHSYEVLGPRWVGAAMAKCPENLPWHRVVNSQGKISPRSATALQRSLLEEEGILFSESDRIDLRTQGWTGIDH